MDGRGRERTQKFKEMRESNYMPLVHCFVGCSDRQTGGWGYMWYVPPTTPTCQSHGPISVMPLLGSKGDGRSCNTCHYECNSTSQWA